nr:hypothetical protein [Tanacetum cinerariifolium]
AKVPGFAGKGWEGSGECVGRHESGGKWGYWSCRAKVPGFAGKGGEGSGECVGRHESGGKWGYWSCRD